MLIGVQVHSYHEVKRETYNITIEIYVKQTVDLILFKLCYFPLSLRFTKDIF